MALKFLPAARQRIAPDEVRILQTVRQLSHPNLISIHRVWCHLGYVIVAMELADGSLADLHTTSCATLGTSLPPEQACLLLSQAAGVLDFLNNRVHSLDGRAVSIQHRDVKPSNLLLFGDTVKLGDFGLSALMMEARSRRVPCGTPEYSPPEVFRGLLCRQSDQYALGVTYCEVRTGRLPFEEPLRTFHPNQAPPQPELSLLSARERPVVARALSHNPDERWSSCGEFMNQLARLLI
jgi:serine/threonine-protein kinase